MPDWNTSPPGGKPVDDLGAAADRADRKSAADDLAESRKVRHYPQFRLRTTQSADAKPRDNLVEDEQGAGLVTEAPEVVVVALRRVDDARVAEDRLDEHRCDRVAVGLEQFPYCGLVVERDGVGVVGKRRRDAGTARRRVDALALDERRLLGAVVAALCHDDIVSAGGGARASRTAETVASVPELTNRTFSTLGTDRATNSASSTSTSVGIPYIGPASTCD